MAQTAIRRIPYWGFQSNWPIVLSNNRSSLVLVKFNSIIAADENIFTERKKKYQSEGWFFPPDVLFLCRLSCNVNHFTPTPSTRPVDGDCERDYKSIALLKAHKSQSHSPNPPTAQRDETWISFDTLETSHKTIANWATICYFYSINGLSRKPCLRALWTMEHSCIQSNQSFSPIHLQLDLCIRQICAIRAEFAITPRSLMSKPQNAPLTATATAKRPVCVWLTCRQRPRPQWIKDCLQLLMATAPVYWSPERRKVGAFIGGRWSSWRAPRSLLCISVTVLAHMPSRNM